MTINKTTLAAIVLIAFGMFGDRLDLPKFSLTSPTTPAITIASPTAELQALVVPVAALVTGDKAAVDRAELAGLFSALAEFHSRDKAAIVSTVQLLQRHNELSLQALYQGTGMAGRYAALGTSVDTALGKHLGIVGTDGKYKAGPIDATASAKVAAFSQAMAWAFSQPLPAAKG